MKVELRVEKDNVLTISINEKSKEIDYKSSDQKIFESANIIILKSIREIDGVVFTHKQKYTKDSVDYKIGFLIANTYKKEINDIRERMKLNEIDLEEKMEE